jgi:hypothetical protein
MAYYTELIAKWATLTPGTTAAKLTQINAITVAGSIPTTIYSTGADIINCIDWTEFNALTDARQKNLLALCAIPGGLLGGSGQLSHMVPGMIVAYFPGGGATITALTAMAKALPWWQATVAQGGGGLIAPVALSDLDQAGGLS